jgi:deoxyhypusine monooxygenase
MCRHEAAEALAALGDAGSLDLLKERRDDEEEEVVVRETCEIAVDRIQWEKDEAQRRTEKLKQRYGNDEFDVFRNANVFIATLLP